ncbi:hypothetical protein IR083_22160 [Dysgonomonas sp. GY75]|uniref:hypothetical protein n=1 Tax=Dysgonomonas sp. GY75 TaxID=2780419 RepID=UPI001883BF81|nr:hypothetical protein [Dysgonomonas sp. GY75]MBF0651524.1 hypothetical protein [Dysgonomonas sp. GY75]
MDPIISGVDGNASVFIIGKLGGDPEYNSIIDSEEVDCANGTFYFGRYSMNETHNIHFNVPGIWRFKAITEDTEHDGEFCSSEIVEVEVQFPEITEIVSAVEFQLDQLWSSTLSAASEDSRKELGFWIYAEVDNNGGLSYSVGETEEGDDITDCSSRATISPSDPEELIPNEPWNTVKFAVAYAHAHTTLYYCPSSIEGRSTGPSEEDDKFANSRKLPILVYDYSANQIYGQDGEGSELYNPAGIKHAGECMQRSFFEKWSSLEESPLSPK